ncbi:PTS fructose transporter subunit IIA [Kitasatospora sp. NPDC088391]|uniref:PTS sugar transporter subunit IIA domain-containing protein n=1 Tax=Kitasatospora sp. NPDC088391 TaxID=3364074 RepID=UPI00381D3C87
MDQRDGSRADVIPITTAPSAPPVGAATGTVPVPGPAVPRPSRPVGHGRVGVVLVSHSLELADAARALALAEADTADAAPVAATGGSPADGPGASALLVASAARRVDQGHGVAVLCDLEGAVRTVLALLARADEHGLPFPVRFADAPFVEGAVAAVATATAGGDLAAVLDAAEETGRRPKH